MFLHILSSLLSQSAWWGLYLVNYLVIYLVSYLVSYLVIIWLSVPVQSIVWKDSSPKWLIKRRVEWKTLLSYSHNEPERLALCAFSLPAVLSYTPPHLAQMSDICYSHISLPTTYCVSRRHVLYDGVAPPDKSSIRPHAEISTPLRNVQLLNDDDILDDVASCLHISLIAAASERRWSATRRQRLAQRLDVGRVELYRLIAPPPSPDVVAVFRH